MIEANGVFRVILCYIGLRNTAFLLQHATSSQQGLKTLFCVPTDDLLRAKDDLLSEGGQSLFSLTEQASDKACNQTGTDFHCYNLTVITYNLYVVICIFYLFHG